MTRDEILSKVRTILVDALAVDDDEVTPTAILTKDLGAESIDFLDIVFKLEQAFGVKIPQGELFPDNVAQDPEYVKDGKVTSNGVAELKKRMPFADLTKFEQNPVVQDFGNLLTVSDLCRYVETKVGAA